MAKQEPRGYLDHWKNQIYAELGERLGNLNDEGKLKARKEVDSFIDFAASKGGLAEIGKYANAEASGDSISGFVQRRIGELAQEHLEKRTQMLEDDTYRKAFEKAVTLREEQRSFITQKANFDNLNDKSAEKLQRATNRASGVRVVGDESSTSAPTGMRELQWGNPFEAKLDSYDQNNDTGKVHSRSLAEVIDTASRNKKMDGFDGFEPVGQVIDALGRPVQRFAHRLTQEEIDQNVAPRLFDLSYEKTTDSFMFGQADSSKQTIIRRANKINQDEQGNLSPGARIGRADILQSIISGHGSANNPVKADWKKRNDPDGWLDEVGTLESVDLFNTNAAQVIDIGSRISIPKPKVGSLPNEVVGEVADKWNRLDPLNRGKSDESREEIYSIDGFNKGYINDNLARMQSARGYGVDSEGQKLDTSAGSTKDFRRYMRGAATGVGPATGRFFSAPDTDDDGYFTSRLGVDGQELQRGQRLLVNVFDGRAGTGEGSFMTTKGNYIQKREQIPLTEYAGKSIEELGISPGQLFSRKNHHVGSIAEGASYAGEYDDDGRIAGLTGLYGQSAVETMIESIEMQQHGDQQVPVVSVLRSSPMDQGEYKSVPGAKGSGQAVNRNNAIVKSMTQAFGQEAQVYLPLPSKQERFESVAAQIFGSEADIGITSDYMMRAAQSLGKDQDAIQNGLFYKDRKGNRLGSLTGDRDMDNAFSVSYSPEMADVALQAARMYVDDRTERHEIKGARMDYDDFNEMREQYGKVGSDKFMTTPEALALQDKSDKDSMDKLEALKRRAGEREIASRIKRSELIETPSGHKFYKVDHMVDTIQTHILGDMLPVNINSQASFSAEYANSLAVAQPEVFDSLQGQMESGVIKPNKNANLLKAQRANIMNEDGSLSDSAAEVWQGMKTIRAEDINFELEEIKAKDELGPDATPAMVKQAVMSSLATQHKDKFIQMGEYISIPFSNIASQYTVDKLGREAKNSSYTAYEALRTYSDNSKKIDRGVSDEERAKIEKQNNTATANYLKSLTKELGEEGALEKASKFTIDAPGGHVSIVPGMPKEMKVLDEAGARKYIERLAKDKANQEDIALDKAEEMLWEQFRTEGLWGTSSMSNANRDQMWQRTHFVSDSWIRGDEYYGLEEQLGKAKSGEQKSKIEARMKEIEGNWNKLGYNKQFFENFRDVEVSEGSVTASSTFVQGQNKDADGDGVGQHILTALAQDQINDPTLGERYRHKEQPGREYEGTVKKHGNTMERYLEAGIAKGSPTKPLMLSSMGDSYAEGAVATENMQRTFTPFVRNMTDALFAGARGQDGEGNYLNEEQENFLRRGLNSGTQLYQLAMDKEVAKSDSSNTLMAAISEMSIGSDSSTKNKFPIFTGSKGILFDKKVNAQEVMFDMLMTHGMRLHGDDHEANAESWYGSERTNNRGVVDDQATMLMPFESVKHLTEEQRAERHASIKTHLNALFESKNQYANTGTRPDAGIDSQQQFRTLTDVHRKYLLDAITGRKITDENLKSEVNQYVGIGDGPESLDTKKMSPLSTWLSSNVVRNTIDRSEGKNRIAGFGPLMDLVKDNMDKGNLKDLDAQIEEITGIQSYSENKRKKRGWSEEYMSGIKLGSHDVATLFDGMYKNKIAKTEVKDKDGKSRTKRPNWPYVGEALPKFTGQKNTKILAEMGTDMSTAQRISKGNLNPEAALAESAKLSDRSNKGVYNAYAPVVKRMAGGSMPYAPNGNPASLDDILRTQMKILGEKMPAQYTRKTSEAREEIDLFAGRNLEEDAVFGQYDRNADFDPGIYDDINPVFDDSDMPPVFDYTDNPDFRVDGGELGENVTFVGERGMEAIVRKPDGGFEVLNATETKETFGDKVPQQLRTDMPKAKQKRDGEDDDILRHRQSYEPPTPSAADFERMARDVPNDNDDFFYQGAEAFNDVMGEIFSPSPEQVSQDDTVYNTLTDGAQSKRPSMDGSSTNMPNSRDKIKLQSQKSDDEEYQTGMKDFMPWGGGQQATRSADAMLQLTGIPIDDVRGDNKGAVYKKHVDSYLDRLQEENPEKYEQHRGGREFYQKHHKRILATPMDKEGRAQAEAARQQQPAPPTQQMPTPTTSYMKVGDKSYETNTLDGEAYMYAKEVGDNINIQGNTVQVEPIRASQVSELLSNQIAYENLKAERDSALERGEADMMNQPEFSQRFLKLSGDISRTVGQYKFMNKAGLTVHEMTDNDKTAEQLEKVMGGAGKGFIRNNTDLNPDTKEELAETLAYRNRESLPSLSTGFYTPEHFKDVSRAKSVINQKANDDAVAKSINGLGDGTKMYQRDVLKDYSQVNDEGISRLDELISSFSETLSLADAGEYQGGKSSELAEIQSVLSAAKGLGSGEKLPGGIGGETLQRLEYMSKMADDLNIQAEKPKQIDASARATGLASQRALTERFGDGRLNSMVNSLMTGTGDVETLQQVKEAQKLLGKAQDGGYDTSDVFSGSTDVITYATALGEGMDLKSSVKQQQSVQSVEEQLPSIEGTLKGLSEFQVSISSLTAPLSEFSGEAKRNVGVMQEMIKAHDVYSEAMKIAGDDTSEGAKKIREALAPFADQMNQIGENKEGLQRNVAQFRTRSNLERNTAYEEEMRENMLMDTLTKRGFTGKRARMSDQYNEMATEGLNLGMGVKLGGKEGGLGRAALEGYGGALRTVRSLQGAMFAGMMTSNQVFKPMADLAGNYEQEQMRRESFLVSQGGVSADDVMDGTIGKARRRRENINMFKLDAGEEIYRSYSGLFEQETGSLGRNAGALASWAGPALGAAMMGNAIGGPVAGLGAGLVAGASALAIGTSAASQDYFNQAGARLDATNGISGGDYRANMLNNGDVAGWWTDLFTNTDKADRATSALGDIRSFIGNDQDSAIERSNIVTGAMEVANRDSIFSGLTGANTDINQEQMEQILRASYSLNSTSGGRTPERFEETRNNLVVETGLDIRTIENALLTTNGDGSANRYEALNQVESRGAELRDTFGGNSRLMAEELARQNPDLGNAASFRQLILDEEITQNQKLGISADMSMTASNIRDNYFSGNTQGGQQAYQGMIDLGVQGFSFQQGQFENMALGQGTMAGNAEGMQEFISEMQEYILKNQSEGQSTDQIQSSMRVMDQLLGNANPALANAGMENLTYSDIDPSRYGYDLASTRRQVASHSELASMRMTSSTFADAIGENYINRQDQMLLQGNVFGANVYAQQAQQTLNAYQNLAPMLTAGERPQAANMLEGLSTLNQDQFAESMSALSGNPYTLARLHSEARGRGETGGLAQGMYSLVDTETGLNPYQMDISKEEAETLQSFDYSGALEGVNLEGVSPIQMQRQMKLDQYAQQDRQYQVGRDTQTAQYSSMFNGGSFTLKPLEDASTEFTEQLQELSGGLEATSEIFASFGFQFNQGDGRGQRQLEDEQIGIQRAAAVRGIDQQEQSLDLGDQGRQLRWDQFFENMGFSQEKFGYQTGRQREDMQLDRGMQLTQRTWQQEDMSMQRSQNELGFGWQMEDMDLNMRYARGRDRRMLMKQQERAVISQGMERAKMDRQEDRTDVKNEFDDTKYGRGVADFSKSIEFQQRAFEMQEKHFREQFALDEQQAALARQRFNQEKNDQEALWKIEDQRRLLERQFQELQIAQQMQLSQENQANAIKFREISDTLTGIAEAYTNQQAKFSATRNSLQGLADVYATMGISSIDTANKVGSSLKQMNESFGGSMTSFVSTAQDSMTKIVAALSNGILALNASISGMNNITGSGSFGTGTTTTTTTPITKIGKAEGGYMGSLAEMEQGAPRMISMAGGGYTGDGFKYNPAGSAQVNVHSGEYIVPQSGVPVVRGDNQQSVEELRRIRVAIEKLASMGLYNVEAYISTSDRVKGSDLSPVDMIYQQ